MLTVTHSHADGTLLEGTTRDDAERIRSVGGWRWSRNLGAWYIPRSRDRDADRTMIARLVDVFEGVGRTVTVEVDNTPRAAADREQARQERAADRADALTAKAARLAAESDGRLAQARQTADAIPLGQPILVGHHSERRHRRDIARIESNTRKGIEAHREAEDAARRAGVAARNAGGKTVGQTRRKIAELEADERRLLRIQQGKGHRAYCDLWEGESPCGMCGMVIGPPPDVSGRLDRVRDDLGYWRGHLADLEADGAKVWGPDDFTVGDGVEVLGGWSRVVRVNKKSLTVQHPVFPEGMTNTVKYDKVCGRRGPDQEG